MDTTTELLREERAKQRQIKADAELFNTLLTHEGWKRLQTLVEIVAQNHYGNVMKPVDSILESAKVEYNKGVLAGLSMAMALPRMKIQEAHDLRRHAQEEDEQ